MKSSFDYIIVGAGSAGCVLANRLSANPDIEVLLIEAGGKDWNPLIHMPAGLSKLINFKSLNWNYHTEPQSELHQRRLYWPRGRVLGGSSSINAMCFSRGHPSDYDDWAALGNSGWGWADVLSYFKSSQDQARGEDTHHGTGGPLRVEDLRFTNALSHAFVEAASQAGYPKNPDFNGATQEGAGFYQVTQRNGRRCSTASAYLSPIKARPNLTVLTHALTQKVTFKGDHASGVIVQQRGRVRTVNAKREVILAAGAINSPQLLMLSGIGPADMLQAHGIDLMADRPQVGQNLQDHLDICVLTECSKPITYDQLNELKVGFNYFFRRQGEGTSNIAEAGAFLISGRHAADRPDIQMHFVPAWLDDHGRNRLPGYGYTVHACPLRPKSRGHLTLQSAEPTHPIAIQPNYLSDPHDLESMLDCIELARSILHQPAFRPYRLQELMPGDDVKNRAGLIDYIRRKAETIYHPVGTCRMGPDADAVVDPKLKVNGVSGLRVVDASIMPTLTGGNTNAPTVMIAEKASDLILSETTSVTQFEEH